MVLLTDCVPKSNYMGHKPVPTSCPEKYKEEGYDDSYEGCI